MSTLRLLLVATAVAIVAAACGEGSTDTDPNPGTLAPRPTTTPIPDTTTTPVTTPVEPAPELRDGIPDVNMGEAIVELSDIHFDTFDGRSIPLDQTSIEVRRRLLDAIPPLDEPGYEPASGGDWLDPGDLVIGYVAGDAAYAFPHKILNFHEIVNDELAGMPVLVSYCPLCRSGVVYDRRLGGRTLSFSNTSALYESDLVMVDRQTGSYWWQVPGRAIVGTLSGRELEPLPSVTTTWEDWVARHPDTQVLSRDTGYGIDYRRDPFVGYQDRVDDGQFAFPVDPDSLDPRLSPGTLILGVEVGGEQKAYPIELLGPTVVNDEVGGDPVVVFVWEDGGAAFSPLVAGRTLTFTLTEAGYVDDQTGTIWERSGEAASGTLVGETMERLPVRSTFWFSYVGAFPEAGVYSAGSG